MDDHDFPRLKCMDLLALWSYERIVRRLAESGSEG